MLDQTSPKTLWIYRGCVSCILSLSNDNQVPPHFILFYLEKIKWLSMGWIRLFFTTNMHVHCHVFCLFVKITDPSWSPFRDKKTWKKTLISQHVFKNHHRNNLHSHKAQNQDFVLFHEQLTFWASISLDRDNIRSAITLWEISGEMSTICENIFGSPVEIIILESFTSIKMCSDKEREKSLKVSRCLKYFFIYFHFNQCSVLEVCF